MPSLRDIVENVAPKLWDAADEGRVDPIPGEWRHLLDEVAADVQAAAAERTEQHPDLEKEECLGYAWSRMLPRVGNVLDYLMRQIRRDLGFVEGSETLAGMMLVRRAMDHLQMELEDGGSPDGREDAEEQTYRMYRALRVLTPRFDDVQLLRVRALRVIETCATGTRIIDDAEVELAVEQMRVHAHEAGQKFDSDDETRQRFWFRAELPMLKTLNARSMLAEIDPAFGTLDPLIVLEDLDESRSGSGGKSDGGEGKTGPARALARLALRCDALGYSQQEGETFDEAADRVRRNLHTARFRLREELRGFPGLLPQAEPG